MIWEKCMEKLYPEWAIGPFEKPVDKPVLWPSEKGFDSWAVYNPAVAVKDQVCYKRIHPIWVLPALGWQSARMVFILKRPATYL